MNIAIVTIVIFCLVSPAIIARRWYNTKELSNKYTQNNTLQEVISSFFLAIILHAIWVCVVQCIFNYNIDFELILKLLFDASSITDYGNITNYLFEIFLYFGSLIFTASIIAEILRRHIRGYKLDRKFSRLRYDNNWYYLFSGEVVDIPDYNAGEVLCSEAINLRLVDVLTKSNNEKTIYRGNLVDYQLNVNNTVEYIVLSEPRKKINNGESVSIESNYFVIPYTEIQNINLKYLSIEEELDNNDTETTDVIV